MTPLCEQCSKKLKLKKDGTVRKGKRFCSANCQQAAIRKTRTEARDELVKRLAELARDPQVCGRAARIRYLLKILGMIKVQR